MRQTIWYELTPKFVQQAERCQYCCKEIPPKKAGRPAKFCSVACRVAHFRAQKSNHDQIPSMDEVRAFLARIRPVFKGVMSLTHNLVAQGIVTEEQYQIALLMGMTHFNADTGRFVFLKANLKRTFEIS